METADKRSISGIFFSFRSGKTWEYPDANKLRLLLFVVLCFLPFTGTAQDRSRMTVYIPMPEGGTEAQRVYFQQNFNQELIGANYRQVDTKAESLYTLFLTIEANPDFDPAYPEDMEYNARFDLIIRLEHSGDEKEIVHFGFPFNSVEDMNKWNLYLLYQALSNAWLPDMELPRAEIDDRWRNKWFYLSPGAGMDTGIFIYGGTNTIRMGSLYPFFLLGMEFHFLHFLSLEADVKLRMMGISDDFFLSPTVSLLLKMAVKPYHDIMLEPYGGVEYSLNIGREPWFSVLGGIQVGLRCNSRSAWTLDTGVTWGPLEGVVMWDGNVYTLLRIHIMAGWKVGFWDRPKRNRAAQNGQTGTAN